MRYIDLPDGTLRKEHSPIENVPFFSDWLEALLVRRAAFIAPGKHGDIDKETGLPRRTILPYDSSQQQACDIMDDGSVRVICLGCAAPTRFWDIVSTSTTKGRDSVRQVPTGKIRIGAIVQFKEDLPSDGMKIAGQVVSVERRWRRRPVSKAGWGCPACVQQYLEEERLVSQDNYNRRAVYEAIRDVYLSRRNIDKLAELKEPTDRTAWIDILPRSVEAEQFGAAMERRL